MTPAALKAQLAPFRAAAATATPAGMRAALDKLFVPEARLRMCHPFGDLTGPEALYSAAYAPLLAALPDLERRDMIVLAGTTLDGQDWIGCMGQYVGTFSAPVLDIPPTGHLAHMRYHEFFRIEQGRVVEMQAIWDIPELMMQARAWPMVPQLGAFLSTPAPMTQDGLRAKGDTQGSWYG